MDLEINENIFNKKKQKKKNMNEYERKYFLKT